MMANNYILRNGYVIDPESDISNVCDIVVLNGKIAAVGENLEDFSCQVIDCAGYIICPGLTDLHCHIYEHATMLGVNPDIHCLSKSAQRIEQRVSDKEWLYCLSVANLVICLEKHFAD